VIHSLSQADFTSR